MLTREENELLCRTGPSDPAGELLRRYWQPVALAEEIEPGSAPMPVRVLSEDLTLFRDQYDRLGLVARHCAHRAADLSYARIEDGGLRCLYHGWLYDIHGNCLEQPGEPEGSTFKDKIQLLSYPVMERAGVVFAYLGPGEPPLLPAYEFLDIAPEHRVVTKIFHECNYQQGNEGNIDPQHLSFLHFFIREDASGSRVATGNVQGGGATSNRMMGDDPSPTIEVEETDYGIRIYAVRDTDAGDDYVRITNFIYPNLASFPAFPGVFGVNWHVPVDDTHHWKFMFMVRSEGPLPKNALGLTMFEGLKDGLHERAQPAEPLPAGPRGDAHAQLPRHGAELPRPRYVGDGGGGRDTGPDDGAPRLHGQGGCALAAPAAQSDAAGAGRRGGAARGPRRVGQRLQSHRRVAGGHPEVGGVVVRVEAERRGAGSAEQRAQRGVGFWVRLGRGVR